MAERRESVRLELTDAGFSTGMVKAAAAASLTERALKSLDGTSVVVHERISKSATGIDGLSSSARNADGSINQLTGRLRLFADIAAILGPSLAPVGGVLVAGIGGLANQMGIAAIAGGVLIGSMQGLGDAFTAIHDAELEPTAENIAKMRDALNGLSPAAAAFATEAYGMLDVLKGIRDAGAEGLFPGLTASLDDLERLAPVVADIFGRFGTALGDIAADGAASLASERWADFFDFIATEGPRTLSDLATTVGDLSHGLAELWIAFAPLNGSFSSWLMDVGNSFDSWASGLSQTDGFRDFVDYIRETGPQVADTMGALANAVVQIVQAAAPLGGPILAGIEVLADTLALLADSNVGGSLIAAAAGFAAVSRAMALINAAKGTALAGLMSDLAKNGEQAGRGARALGVGLGSLLAIPALDAAQTQFEGLSTGLNALTRDLSAGTLPTDFDNLAASLERLSNPNLAQGLQDSIYKTLPFLGTDSRVDEATAQFEALDAALVNIATTEGPAQARAALEGLASSMGLTAEQTADLLRLLPQYRDAVEGISGVDFGAHDEYLESLQAESDELERNIGLMRTKRDEALRSFSAQTNYSQALLDSKEALKENGRAWNLNSDAGLANRRVVEQQASAWNELNRTQGQTPAQARKARSALEDTAMSLGASREEARRYARQLLDIPNKLETKIDADVNGATSKIDALEARLRAIKDEDVFVNVRQIGSTTLGPRNENALGDFKNAHSPQIAPGGAMRVWAEPETGGESYIPHANDGRRPRAKNILEQTATLFGGSVQWFAEGGTTGMKDGKKKPKPQGAYFVVDNSDSLQAAIDRLTMVSEDQTRAVEDQTRRTDEWAQKMSEVASATISGFDTGLFEKDSNPWAAGAGGGPLANIMRDIAGLNERAGLQSQLAGLGITGDALAAILGQGSNADIAGLLASGQAVDVAAAFNQRAGLQGSVGQQGAQAAFGAQYAESLKVQQTLATSARATELEIVRLNGKVEALAAALAFVPDQIGEGMGRALNGAASKGHRDRRNGGGPV